MTWQELYKKRLVPAKRALKAVERGDRVFVGTACAEPQVLVQALLDKADNLNDVEILHFVTLGRAIYTESRFDRRFRHNAYFIGPTTRDAVNQGRADYTPVFSYQVPDLFTRGEVPIDVALIQVSPPDPHGWVSLGISVDITRQAAECAGHVIAQVNPRMPRTVGNSFLHVKQIDAFVEHEEPLMEFIYPEADQVGDQIAANVAKLVDDGSTLHIGYGHIPYRVLGHLEGKRDLGFHTEVVSDAFIPLIENGVITGNKKNSYPGRVVCSFCIGSHKTYRYVDNNPSFQFLPCDFVYNPLEIAKNDRVVSISSALEVDLTGQVSGESAEYNFSAGFGGRLDFMRGAAMSEHGKPVVALPSTTKDGNASRIVHRLGKGASVVATRGDVHYVVTEYGIAYLHGRSIRERAMALINIAHPEFRGRLLEDAKAHAMVFSDQILVTTTHDLYPKDVERMARLKDRTQVRIRPIKPTDEVALQKYFYSHSEKTVYNRYFRPVRAMPHTTAQGMVNLDYDQEMALVATTGMIARERIVGVARYSKDKDSNMAETAFTVHEDYQGKGLGSVLQKDLVAYARKKGLRGVWAVTFGSNRGMLGLFAKLGPYQKKSLEPGIWRLEHIFEPPDEADEA